MNNNLSQIEFYFPDKKLVKKEGLVESIIALMKKQRSTDYCGYPGIDLLREGLVDHIGNEGIEQYKTISDDQKLEIEKIVSKTIERCNEYLTIPTENFVFIFPWLSTKEGSRIFEGSYGFAPYSCVFYLFAELDQYTKKSIENTVAHELNHTVYYYNHDDFNNYTLLGEVLLEGFAENFREQYFDPNTSKWPGALSKEEAFKVLKESEEIIESRDQRIIKEFLFGNEKYQRWTGYSVGYWLVKEFIESKPKIFWDELIKIKPQIFLTAINK